MIQPPQPAQVTALHLATLLTRISAAGMKASKTAKYADSDRDVVVVDATAWAEYRRATILAMRGMFQPVPEHRKPQG